MPSADWTAPTATGPVDARVVLPGSKSLTNRYLVLAALANDVSRLRAPLRSRDTLLMAQALRTLGAVVEDVEDGDWLVTPGRAARRRRGRLRPRGQRHAVRPAPGRARGRTGPVRRGRRTRGCGRWPRCSTPCASSASTSRTPAGAGLPFTVRGHGSVRGGAVTLDASASSQFVSGLLLSGARFDEGVTVRHEGPAVPSLPHIEMTVETLRDAGVVVDDGDVHTWRVEPSEVNALDVQVEPDLSNAAQFLAAALVTGGRVHVPGWPQYTTQGGDFVRDVLDMMGAEVVLDREGLTVSGVDGVTGVDVDLHDSSELTPVVAAVCALAEAPSVIRGVAHIRGHETDRLAALRTELTGLGTPGRGDRRRAAHHPATAARRHLPHPR